MLNIMGIMVVIVELINPIEDIDAMIKTPVERCREMILVMIVVLNLVEGISLEENETTDVKKRE